MTQQQSRKPNVLFLCTGNSCRSQMAEGWARHLCKDSINAYSAGIEKHGLNPRAVEVMGEAGVDISSHQSKTVDEIGIAFDCVITVCGHAHETCPVFLGSPHVLHVGFDDPPRLAKLPEHAADPLQPFRRVRDEIRAFIETLPATISDLTKSS
jgi:arsenate reductase